MANERSVPPDEWQFVLMDNRRKDWLENTKFTDIKADLATKACIDPHPWLEPAQDRKACRVVFPISVCDTLGDVVHNGRDGLRPQYWLSPEEGDAATRHLINAVRAKLLGALPEELTTPKGESITNEAAVAALGRPSAKI